MLSTYTNTSSAIPIGSNLNTVAAQDLGGGGGGGGGGEGGGRIRIGIRAD